MEFATKCLLALVLAAYAVQAKPLVGNPAPEFKAVAVYNDQFKEVSCCTCRLFTSFMPPMSYKNLAINTTIIISSHACPVRALQCFVLHHSKQLVATDDCCFVDWAGLVTIIQGQVRGVILLPAGFYFRM